MRFGITALEFGPIANELVRDGVPDLSRFNLVRHARQALQIRDISVLELSLDICHIIPNAFTEQTLADLNDLKDEHGVSYTVHLPLYSIELATFNNPVREGGIDSIVSSIKTVESLDPEAYVLHSTGPLAAEYSRLTYPPETVRTICTLMSAFSANSIEEIISKSEINPRKLAVENLEFPFDITRTVIDEYDTSICFDTGHLLSKQSGDESVLEFYQEHRDRIIEVHLHDGCATRITEGSGYIDHRPLGTYDLPIRDFLMKLMDDKFNGPLIFELSPAQTEESLAKIREVVPEAIT